MSNDHVVTDLFCDHDKLSPTSAVVRNSLQVLYDVGINVYVALWNLWWPVQ